MHGDPLFGLGLRRRREPDDDEPVNEQKQFLEGIAVVQHLGNTVMRALEALRVKACPLPR
jgi:hypothetical protein